MMVVTMMTSPRISVGILLIDQAYFNDWTFNSSPDALALWSLEQKCSKFLFLASLF